MRFVPQILVRQVALTLTLFLVLTSQQVFAQDPYLAFSDLISGPNAGLGDNLGNGAIVTAWGQSLGTADSNRKLIFEDLMGKTYEPYIYYWKDADGVLPSGPANLYESHRMQELAFSIPAAAEGLGRFYVELNGEASNSLPFLVRSGAIFHVSKRVGVTGDGSWEKPWLNVKSALNVAPAGSTIYIHDVDSGSFEAPPVRAIYWNNAASSSSLDSQFTIAPYPGFQPKVIGQQGVTTFRVEGMVVSKLDVYASNYLSVDSNGQPTGNVISTSPSDTFGIFTSKNGRIIGNRIGDIPGGCSSKWNGAINGTGDLVGNNKLLGNEIYEYGCNGSSKLHHTSYLSIRASDNRQVEPWEWGYNYLHDNKAMFGIHNYDQGEGCGDLTGPLKIHHNVVVNQGGAGISVGSTCGWSMDMEIENNVLINVGLAAAWDGVDVTSSNGSEGGGIALWDSGLLGTAYIRNNLIYKWNADKSFVTGALVLNGWSDNVSVIWSDNIAYTESDLPFFLTGFNASNKIDNVEGENNIWHYSGLSANKAIVPFWDASPITMDPKLEVSGSVVRLDAESPAVDQAIGVYINRDIYGVSLGSSPDIGPVEFRRSPPMAPSLLNVD
jgi:hypothetical protein